VTIVLGIEKTHVTAGDDRFSVQLVEERESWTGCRFGSFVIEDLTEDLVRRIGASGSLSVQDLNHYLALARLNYHAREARLS
jgi:hypothetical protein